MKSSYFLTVCIEFFRLPACFSHLGSREHILAFIASGIKRYFCVCSPWNVYSKVTEHPLLAFAQVNEDTVHCYFILFHNKEMREWGCASQAEEHSSQCLVQSESATLTEWMYGMKGEEDGRHLPLLMNSTKSMQHTASFSKLLSLLPSFSLHSVCAKGAVHHYSRTELIKGD